MDQVPAARMPVDDRPRKPLKSATVRRERSERKPHYLRLWRIARGIGSLEEMVDRLAKRGRVYSVGYLSRVETNTDRYNQDLLEAYAEILECEPGELLLHAPPDAEPILQSLAETAAQLLKLSNIVRQAAGAERPRRRKRDRKPS